MTTQTVSGEMQQARKRGRPKRSENKTDELNKTTINKVETAKQLTAITDDSTDISVGVKETPEACVLKKRRTSKKEIDSSTSVSLSTEKNGANLSEPVAPDEGLSTKTSTVSRKKSEKKRKEKEATELTLTLPVNPCSDAKTDMKTNISSCNPSVSQLNQNMMEPSVTVEVPGLISIPPKLSEMDSDSTVSKMPLLTSASQSQGKPLDKCESSIISLNNITTSTDAARQISLIRRLILQSQLSTSNNTSKDNTCQSMKNGTEVVDLCLKWKRYTADAIEEVSRISGISLKRSMEQLQVDPKSIFFDYESDTFLF
eukprot:Tbor_TRINITY_DN5337_c2_g1::TRINITY_DN5337_c2_g1_i1::g.4208::m.4208